MDSPPDDSPSPNHGHRLLSPLRRLARLIAVHVRTVFGALAVFLSLGFILAVGGLLLFGYVAREVLQGDTQVFDEAVLTWFAGHRVRWLDRMALEVTKLGDGVLLAVVVVVASLFLWLTHHRYSVYLLLAGAFGGYLLNVLLKAGFARPRPSIVEAVRVATSASFPSGHAMASVIVYGSVAYLVARLESTRTLRRWTWTVAVTLIVLIGLTRMYLGVHYPSDVLAGFVVGFAWTAFVAASLAAVQAQGRRKPEIARREHDLEAGEQVGEGT